MDRVAADLQRVEQELVAEVRAHLRMLPQFQMLRVVRRVLAQRRHATILLPPDRLLCEMLHEARALAVWENEGGAVADKTLCRFCGACYAKAVAA